MGNAKKSEIKKALFELNNHCKKTIDKRNLIDQLVIKAAISATSFFLHSLLLKNVVFCTGFNLFNPIFLLPYIIMDLNIFVIAEWATLLVDIRCPRGGS